MYPLAQRTNYLQIFLQVCPGIQILPWIPADSAGRCLNMGLDIACIYDTN